MPKPNKPVKKLGFILVAIWILFTVSLVTWWIIFGSQQVERLALLDNKDAADLARYQKMLVTEGAAMILCLLGGGGALFYYLYRQIKEANRLKIFFAAFTHEIKTPLAGALLKLEILEEKLEDTSDSKQVIQVKQDLERLAMQIENSLFLADESTAKPIFSKIHLSEFLTRIAKLGWRGLIKIEVIGDAILSADERMLEAIVRNLLRNAVKHGKADVVKVVITPGANFTTVEFTDNGQGFSGDRSQLTKLFTRHYSGSGSGIGLYLVNKLTMAMGGKVTFVDNPANGFVVKLQLKA